MSKVFKLPDDFSWARSIFIACGLIWIYIFYLASISMMHVHQMKSSGLLISYSAKHMPHYLTKDLMNKVFNEVENYWQTQCGITLKFQENAPDTTFSVSWARLVSDESMDTAGRARAVHSLLGPQEAQIYLDSSGFTLNRNQVSLVLAHEVGHMLGLEHTSTGLMAPVIDSPVETLSGARVNCPQWKLM